MQPLPSGFDIPLPFNLQPFHIYFYGIFIMTGVIAAAFLAQAEAKRRGMNPDFLWDALFWVVLAGIAICLPLAWLGHLPGDITFKGKNVTFYFPLATSLLISVILSLILWLINHK